jgi:hypothetical protein
MSVLEILRELECELHDPSTRRNRERLAQLLHPAFREFGRSGAVGSREEVIAHLLAETEPPKVVAHGFAVLELAPSAVLLTYQSAHVSAAGSLERHANRASVWLREGSGWQMVFHQGTPTMASEHNAA